MNRFILSFLLCFCYLISFAQQQQLNGVVLDETTLEPLIGSTILVKGTGTGQSTDINGNFSINVTPGQVLEVSYIGMIKKEVEVSVGINNITIYLSPNNLMMDELVVVGYGVTRKRDIAGAITSLKTDDIKAGVVTSTAQLMKGRAAGVHVRQNSAEPGGGISIRVRGASSISSNNEPLYVIDGFQTDIGNQINPEDIESIEILKDAAATAIYGARGANGVVLITTKKGMQDVYNVSYSHNTSVKNLHNPWKLMDAQDVISQGMKEWEEGGKSGNSPYTQEQLQYKGKGADWIEATTHTALTQTHQVMISGGSDKMTMAVSANYLNDEGILQNTEFDRFSSRMNLDYRLSERVRFGSNVYFARSNKNYLNMGTTTTIDNVIYNIFLMSPLTLVNGDNVFGEKGRKPGIFSELNDVDFESITNNMYATLHGEVDILKSLTARVQYTYSNDNTKAQKYYPKTTTIGKGNDGLGTINNYKTDRKQLDALLTWHEQFLEIHNFKLMGGMTYANVIGESNGMQGFGYSTDEFSFNNMGAAQTVQWINSWREDNTKLSFFGRGEYVLLDKYIFNASIRADGSSNFGPGNKWGYFPSGSMAWQLGEEPFMAFTKPLFYDIKLRASYGITGNDGIGNYLSQRKFGITDVYLGGGSIVKGMYPSNPENLSLKWESTSQLNLGVDFSLFEKRVEVNFDYYNKITSDLLNPVSVSTSTGGFSTMMGNNGKIRNRGFEFFLKTNNFVKRDFSWKSTFNLSRNKNMVLDLNQGEARFETVRPQGWYNWEEYAMLKEGYPLSTIYGYIFEGIIQKGETYSSQPTSVPGDPKFKDLDGDGVITIKDRTIIGDGNPDFIFGIGNNLTYRNFDFSFFFDASLGANLLNLSRVVLEGEGRLKESADKWTQMNPSNMIPRAGYRKDSGLKYGSFVNSRFVENADYFRLQNVELGYNLPVRSIGDLNTYIKDLRLFIGAQNLFTITSYTGFDPEVSTNGGSAVSQGLDFSSYPSFRMVNFGVKITF